MRRDKFGHLYKGYICLYNTNDISFADLMELDPGPLRR